MAIDRFFTPAELTVQSMFVPQATQAPTDALQFLVDRRDKVDEDADKLQADFGNLNWTNIAADEGEKRRKQSEVYRGIDATISEVDNFKGVEGLSELDQKVKGLTRNLSRLKQTDPEILAMEGRARMKAENDAKIREAVKGKLIDSEMADELILASDSMPQSRSLYRRDKEGNVVGFNNYVGHSVVPHYEPQERGVDLTDAMAKKGGGYAISNGKMISTIDGNQVPWNDMFNITHSILNNDDATKKSLRQDNLIERSGIDNKGYSPSYSEEKLDEYFDEMASVTGNTSISSYKEGSYASKVANYRILNAAKSVADLRSTSPNQTLKSAGGDGNGSTDDLTGLSLAVNTAYHPVKFNSSAGLINEKSNINKSLSAAEADLQSFLNKQGVTEANPVTEFGKDYSDEIRQKRAAIQQQAANLGDIEAYEIKMMNAAGVYTENFKDDMDQAKDKALEDLQRELTGGGDLGHVKFSIDMQDPVKKEEYLQGRIQKHMVDTPAYDRYNKYLKENHRLQQTTIGLNAFKSSNVRTTVKSLTETVLLGGGDKNLRGAKWVSTEEGKADRELNKKEFDSLDKIGDVFWGYNPQDDEIQTITNGFDSDGKTIGTISTKAPDGLIYELIGDNQLTFASVMVNSFITDVDKLSQKEGTFEGITLKIPSRTTNNIESRTGNYVLEFPDKEGNTTIVSYNNKNDANKAILALLGSKQSK